MCPDRANRLIVRGPGWMRKGIDITGADAGWASRKLSINRVLPLTSWTQMN